MESVYSRPVIVVPTNRPVIREQWPMRVFRTQESKWRAIAESIAEFHAKGRPVLVGTRSIAASS
jgi:preprotein translocase subunit SecA